MSVAPTVNRHLRLSAGRHAAGEVAVSLDRMPADDLEVPHQPGRKIVVQLDAEGVARPGVPQVDREAGYLTGVNRLDTVGRLRQVQAGALDRDRRLSLIVQPNAQGRLV
jgi:hypothetical protein